MVRIVDVADQAGVSIATVSRVLNGKQVSEAARLRVMQAVDQLGYRPNKLARSLRLQHAEVIALVVPDIENPFFTSFARGVESVARGEGYSVMLCNSDGDKSVERDYLEAIVEGNMAGAIIAPTDPDLQIDVLVKNDIKVVIADREIAAEVDQIVYDNVALGYDATRVLVEQGFRKIACVTGPRSVKTASERAQGWRMALDEAGISVPESFLQHRTFRVAGGDSAAEEWASGEERPEAVLCANNLVAVGVLRTLSRHEVTDVSVAVIGDIPFATTMSENLWVVSLDTEDLGRQAAEMLFERIVVGHEGQARRVVVERGGAKNVMREGLEWR